MPFNKPRLHMSKANLERDCIFDEPDCKQRHILWYSSRGTVSPHLGATSMAKQSSSAIQPARKKGPSRSTAELAFSVLLSQRPTAELSPSFYGCVCVCFLVGDPPKMVVLLSVLLGKKKKNDPQNKDRPKTWPAGL